MSLFYYELYVFQNNICVDVSFRDVYSYVHIWVLIIDFLKRNIFL